MADYYPLIAKAVAGLDKGTGEARRALYERARSALVTQLRGVSPALSESDITRERLALEEAIRKVEAEAARNSRFDPPPERKRADAAEPQKPAGPPPPPEPAADHEGDDAESGAARIAADLRRVVRPPAEEHGPASNGLKGFRHVVADVENLGDATAQASRSAREAYNAMPSPTSEFERLEPRMEPEGLRARDRRRDPAVPMRDSAPARPAQPPPPVPKRERGAEPAPRNGMRERPPTRGPASREPVPDFGKAARANDLSMRNFGPLEGLDREAGGLPQMDFDAASPRQRPGRRPEPLTDEEEQHVAPPSRLRELIIPYLVVFAVVVLVAGVIVWQWQPMVGAVRGLVSSFKTAQPAPPQPAAPPTRPKITDRIGSNDSAAPGQQQPAAADVAQRVVLYEEDPDDPAGKRFVGSAVWRTESVAAAAGQPPETVVRADIDIPERKMTMKWSLGRNSDKAFPASHTVEVMFSLPQGFPHGGIQNVPGVLMKEAEQTRGVPLSGLAVKVTDGYFLIGLSAVDTEMQRNLVLLKERPWFDVPIVYTDGRRAILAVEKGAPGERAFRDAFAAWKQ
ncbi:MAG TPA: hypothetical protein VFU97_17640 [Xanthobacteraceae bacterium]|nr:hypothetical protein [Xanthobacteraceae bacterium]